MSTRLADWSSAVLGRTELALDALLPPADAAPQQLHEAMRYAVLNGGKRVRPLLVHAAGELAQRAAREPATGEQAPGVHAKPQGSADAPYDALDRAACAVELIHAYSLVHDDLPCMDNDTLRRGKPTVWAAYGEACAMLVGDGLQALAFGALAQAGSSIDARATVAMIAELAQAAGSHGMVGGQALDLESVGRTLSQHALEAMHRRKTGALLRASVRLGALAVAPAESAVHQSLELYAAAVGLAFQVIDDVLDVEADTATLGKTAGKDRDDGKPTYVSAMGLDAARVHAMRLRDDAHAALEPFGEAAGRLRGLADLIVSRRS